MNAFCRNCATSFVAGLATLLLLAFLISASTAHGGDYRARKKAGPYTVDVAINRNPPILGINELQVEIRDGAGRNLTGARGSVNYSMPPMPGMVPMNYTVGALPYRNGYHARMNFIMTGPWNIAIRFEAAGNFWRVAIPLDVR